MLYKTGKEEMDAEEHIFSVCGMDRKDIGTGCSKQLNFRERKKKRMKQFKKKYYRFLAMLLAVVMIFSMLPTTAFATEVEVPVTGVKLDKDNLELEVGKNSTLVAAIEPENATDNMISWKSENEEIATVENGVVTAVAEGQTTITAKAGDFSAQCSVTVTAVLPTADIPVITTDLEAEQALCALNSSVSLRVRIKRNNNVTLSYQWYSNTAASTEGAEAIEGASGSSSGTSITYRPSTSIPGTMYYFVVLTNSKDGYAPNSLTSNITKFTVGSEQPKITENLNTKEVNYAVGDTAAPLSVTANVTDGGTLSYKWYKNTSNSSKNGTVIEGATEASYTPSTTENGTFYYYVIVTNTNGEHAPISATSRVAMITTASAKPVITKDLSTDKVGYNIGDRAQPLSIEASVSDGGMLTYQWYKDGTAIEGATESAYTPDTTIDSTARYHVVVTNTKGEYTSVTTQSATASVITLSELTVDLTCNFDGTSFEYTLPYNNAISLSGEIDWSASGIGDLTYKLYKNSEESYEGAKLVREGTNSYIDLAPTTKVGTTYYYVEVTNTLSGKSTTAKSNWVSITVKAAEEDKFGLITGEDAVGAVTVTIEDTQPIRDDLIDGMGELIKDPGGIGTVLSNYRVYIYPSDTVMSIISRACLLNNIEIEGAEDGYISNIKGRAEFDRGVGSGWMGSLNGWYTNEGFLNYSVASGDVQDGAAIQLSYTLDLGTDLGTTPGSAEKRLSNLMVATDRWTTTVSHNLMVPAFDPDIHEYYVSISENASALYIRATAMNKNNKVKVLVDGESCLFNGTYAEVKPDGDATIEVIVESPDGSSRETYTIYLVKGHTLLGADNLTVQTVSADGNQAKDATVTYYKSGMVSDMTRYGYYVIHLAPYSQNISYNGTDLKLNLAQLPEGAKASLIWDSQYYDFTDGTVIVKGITSDMMNQAQGTLYIEADGEKEAYLLILSKYGPILNSASVTGSPAFSETLNGVLEGTMIQVKDGLETETTGFESDVFDYNIYHSAKIDTITLSAQILRENSAQNHIGTYRTQIYVNNELATEKSTFAEAKTYLDSNPITLDKESGLTEVKVVLTRSDDEAVTATYHFNFIKEEVTPSELEVMIRELPELEELTYGQHNARVTYLNSVYKEFTDEQKAELSKDAVTKLLAAVEKMETEFVAGDAQIKELVALIESYANKVTEENYKEYQADVLKSVKLYDKLSGWIFEWFIDEHLDLYDAMKKASEIVNKARIAGNETIGTATDYVDDFILTANAFNLTIGSDEKAYPVVFRDYIASTGGEACLPYNIPGRLEFNIADPTIFRIDTETVQYEDMGLGGGGIYENELYYLVPLKEGTTTFSVTLKDEYGNYYGQLPEMIVHVNSKEETVIEDLENKLTNINALPNTTKYDTWYFWEGTEGAPFTFTVHGTDAEVYVWDYRGSGSKTKYPVAADGRVTVLLKDGYNPIEVTAVYEGQKVTQVYGIRGKAASYQINNVSRPGQAFRQGDEIEVIFTGLTTPVKKILRIYNPSGVQYIYDTDMPYQSQVHSTGTQYQAGTITFELTGSGTITLTNGRIYERWWGDPLYSELSQGNTGEIAPQSTVYFSRIPDISIEVEDYSKYTADILVTPVIEGGNTVKPGQTVTLTMDDLDLKWITDTYPQDISDTYNCLVNAQSVFATTIPGMKSIASKEYYLNANVEDMYPLSTIRTIELTVPEDTPDGTYRIYGGFISIMHGHEAYGTYPKYLLKTMIDDVEINVSQDSHECLWDEGTLTKEATATDSGIRTYHCTVEGCTKIKTETIPATGHTVTKTVAEQIASIGEVTLAKEAQIKAIRAAYNALTDAEKALVTNYETLVEAENQLVKLKKELEEMLGNVNTIYKTTADYLTGLGTPGVGSIGGEWMVIGLERSGREVSEDYYDNVVDFVKENINDKGQLDKSKSSENSRVIIALTAAGYDVTDVDGYNLLEGLSSLSFVKKQGINGVIWALIALDTYDYEIPVNENPDDQTTRQKLIDTILSKQLTDDGWALSGKVSDVDMTGMAIQALAPYYGTNSEVKSAVDKALAYLSEVQHADGSFGSVDGSSAESCAQVIVALTALGINPDTDTRFVKNGNSVVDALCTFYVEGGGFKHTPAGALNGMATEQGYYALVSYVRMLSGQTSLYDMSDVMSGEDNSGDNTGEDETDRPEDETDKTEEGTGDNTGNNETDKVDEKDDSNKSPDTGDMTPIFLVAVAAMLSLVGCAIIIGKKRNA